jgi:hypothetical protein
MDVVLPGLALFTRTGFDDFAGVYGTKEMGFMDNYQVWRCGVVEDLLTVFTITPFTVDFGPNLKLLVCWHLVVCCSGILSFFFFFFLWSIFLFAFLCVVKETTGLDVEFSDRHESVYDLVRYGVTSLLVLRDQVGEKFDQDLLHLARQQLPTSVLLTDLC